MCEKKAVWVVAAFGDPNEANPCCEAHVVAFLKEAADTVNGLGANEIHVYPVEPEKQTALCSFEETSASKE